MRLWRSQTVGDSKLDRLIEDADKARYGQDAPEKHFVLFSKAGFAPALIERAANDSSLHLLTLYDIVRGDREPTSGLTLNLI